MLSATMHCNWISLTFTRHFLSVTQRSWHWNQTWEDFSSLYFQVYLNQENKPGDLPLGCGTRV